ncbi:MotA/TolQ/ExbB proton channel family protein [bacterium]|nr:MotA/TolQ/ExbB proton channel family protein [bacterium]
MTETLVQAYNYLAKGGPVMILIGLCSIVAVAIVIERYLALKKTVIFPKPMMRSFNESMRKKDWQSIAQLSQVYDVPLTRLSSLVLSHGNSNYQQKKDAVEMQGRLELEGLEKNLNLLGSIASISPLLGLLGTVTGMIKTFAAIKLVGVGDPLELSAGISEALLNTAAGLLVAIPAYVLHRHFYKKIDHYGLKLEELSQSLLNNFKTKENDTSVQDNKHKKES